jgi:hypothetical protein
MAKLVTFEELIVTIRVPADLPDAVTAKLARALKSKTFQGKLRRTVRTVFSLDPVLASARVRVCR